MRFIELKGIKELFFIENKKINGKDARKRIKAFPHDLKNGAVFSIRR